MPPLNGGQLILIKDKSKFRFRGGQPGSVAGAGAVLDLFFILYLICLSDCLIIRPPAPAPEPGFPPRNQNFDLFLFFYLIIFIFIYIYIGI